MRVIPYSGRSHRVEWNNFLLSSRNKSFLYHRDYVDYLSTKFEETSILVLNTEDQLVGCMPCNRLNTETIVSHSGLTYGGLLLTEKVKLGTVIEIFFSIYDYFKKLGVKILTYRDIPSIYSSVPVDDIDYCMYLSKAKIIQKRTSSTIKMSRRIRYSGNIRRASAKAIHNGVRILESTDYGLFWRQLLVPLLGYKFYTKPVHSLKEIEELNFNFPENIRLFLALNSDDRPLAGVVIYETEFVIHCQYIASNEEGRTKGALDYLLVKLIDEKFQSATYFDFGTSNTFDELEINPGLLKWKERMGGRTIIQNTYEIEVENAVEALRSKEVLW